MDKNEYKYKMTNKWINIYTQIMQVDKWIR